MSIPTSRHATAADDLFGRYLWLANNLARRATRHPSEAEDLVQISRIALWETARRFDPDRAVPFEGFARRVVGGHIMRYKRDHTRTVRLSRPAHDAYFVVLAAVDDLTAELHRAPTIAEISERTGRSEDQVLLGLEAAHRGRVYSLDEAPDDPSRPPSAVEDGYERVNRRQELADLMPALDDGERLVVGLRFFHEMTQSEIAATVGCSQMHISRMLRASLEKLRRVAAEAEAALHSPLRSASA
jgi:RNA polymerase sigma-B factor